MVYKSEWKQQFLMCFVGRSHDAAPNTNLELYKQPHNSALNNVGHRTISDQNLIFSIHFGYGQKQCPSIVALSLFCLQKMPVMLVVAHFSVQC